MTIRELSLEILKITNGAGWVKLYDLEQGRLELLLEREVKNLTIPPVIKSVCDCPLEKQQAMYFIENWCKDCDLPIKQTVL